MESIQSTGWLFLAILIAYGCAVVAPLPRHRSRGRAGALVSWCFVPVILLCPVLIPSLNVGLRAAAAFASGEIAFKMVEFFRRWNAVEGSVVLRAYYRFLIPFPVLAVVYPDHKRRLPRPESRWPHVVRFIAGIVGVTVAVAAIVALSSTTPIRSSFALNHAVMLLTFVLAIESLSRSLWALERLAGFETTPIVRNAYRSRTVAEFWQRYNYRVHEWLYRNVFHATGGRRTPVRSLLLAFLVSGLFHELMFALATSRLTGYQFAFFTLQGPAVLTSGHLERLAKRGGMMGKIVAHGVTIFFVGITSVLFFDGVREVFPFIYASESPLP